MSSGEIEPAAAPSGTKGVALGQETGDGEHVILDLEERSQSPKSRKLLADSNWESNPYFGLTTLSEKKKTDEELETVQHSGTREYYKELNTLITDLEDMAAGKSATEEEAEGM